MTDLVAFLRARLDERAAKAEAACHGGEGRWRQDDAERYPGRIKDDRGDVVVHDEGDPSGEQAAHIVANDPARVLAEVEAKRKTLVRCEEALLSANPMLVHFAEQTVREMALPYAEHPEYQEERRP